MLLDRPASIVGSGSSLALSSIRTQPRDPNPLSGPAPRSPLASALGYVARVLGWIVAFLALIRIPAVQGKLFIPFARWQRDVACGLIGAPRDAISIDFSCTGADAMALCLGAVLAFPTTWRKRLVGAAAGFALVSLINTVRVGHLSVVAGSGRLFQFWHFQAWPAVLIVAVAAYVFWWMRIAGRGQGVGTALAAGPGRRLAWRFLVLTVLLVAVYYGAADRLFENAAVLAAARGVAWLAGSLLSLGGIPVEVSQEYLKVGRFPYRVTQECIASPLMPVYLAAALAAPLAWWKRGVLVLLAGPVFFLLGTARMLVLALPRQLVGAPGVLLHAFHQLVLGAGLIVAAAWWVRRRAASSAARPAGAGSAGGGAWGVRALAALAGALALAALAGPAWSGVVGRAADAVSGSFTYRAPVPDPQLALKLLPGYQLALFAGLWLAAARSLRDWRRPLLGLAALAVFQIGLLASLAGLAGRWDFAPGVAMVRGLAIVVPLALAWVLTGVRHRRPGVVTEPAPSGSLEPAPTASD